MKWLPIAVALLVSLMAIPTQAQTPAESGSTLRFSGGITPGEVAATPEMWFYQEQMSRRDDPKEALRRKAEFRTAQREARLVLPGARRKLAAQVARLRPSPGPFRAVRPHRSFDEPSAKTQVSQGAVRGPGR